MLLTVLLHLVPVSASITYCTIVTIQKIIPLSYITCQPVMLSEKCVLCWCQFLTVLSSSFKNFMNNEGQFKVALKRYLNMHTFWSVDEVLMLNNDLPYFILKSNKDIVQNIHVIYVLCLCVCVCVHVYVCALVCNIALNNCMLKPYFFLWNFIYVCSVVCYTSCKHSD
jgi:hypothetical protein